MKMMIMMMMMVMTGAVKAISTSNLDPSEVDPLTSDPDPDLPDPNSVSYDPKYDPDDPNFDLSALSLDLIFPELSKYLKRIKALQDPTQYDMSLTPEAEFDPSQTDHDPSVTPRPEPDPSLIQGPDSDPKTTPKSIPDQKYPTKSLPKRPSDLTATPDLGVTPGKAGAGSGHRMRRHFSSIDVCGEALCDQMVRQATGLARVKMVRRFIMDTVKAMDSLVTALDAELVVTGETLARSLGNRCRSAHALLTHVTKGPTDSDRLNGKNSRFIYGGLPNHT